MKIELDVREKKSPRFIEKEFTTIPATLPAGDIRKAEYTPLGYQGVGIEFKLSLSDQKAGDYGIHTEPIERFHDELANKIKPFMISNPLCDFHAIWWKESYVSDHEKEMWDHYCQQYYVWGHVVRSKKSFITLIKKIFRGDYVRDQVYVKRSHTEPAPLAKGLRQVDGVSTETAIQLSQCKSREEIQQVKGILKTNGHWTKLSIKLEIYLRTICDFYKMWRGK